MLATRPLATTAAHVRRVSTLVPPLSPASGQVPSAAAQALLRPTEAYLSQAYLGLQSAGCGGSRGAQAEQLARLSDTLGPQARQLPPWEQGLPLDPQDPSHDLVQRRLATASQVHAFLAAALHLLGAHEGSQCQGEVPVLRAGWRDRLCEEACAQLHQLAARNDPRDHAQAGLHLACAPAAMAKMLSLESLPQPVHRQALDWGGPRAQQGLPLTHWLALRLYAHPDSGAATAQLAMELLGHLDRDLQEAALPLLRDFSRQHARAVANAAQLPGLGVADLSARYHVALPTAAGLLLEDAQRDAGGWLIGRPLPAFGEAAQAVADAGGGNSASATLLCLQSAGAHAGPVRGLRFDIFHPPLAHARQHVLLMPGQCFRVTPADDEVGRLTDGQRLEARRYRLDKLGEEACPNVPGTGAGGDLSWKLATAL